MNEARAAILDQLAAYAEHVILMTRAAGEYERRGQHGWAMTERMFAGLEATAAQHRAQSVWAWRREYGIE